VEWQIFHIIDQDNFSASKTTLAGDALRRDLFQKVCDEVNAEYGTHYKFTWEYYYNACLYSPSRAIDAVALGNLTTCGPTSYMMQPFEPRMGMGGNPSMIRGRPHQVSANDPGACPVINDILNVMESKNIHLYTLTTGRAVNNQWILGQYNIYSKDPVYKWEDLEGLRVRTMTDPQQIKMGAALGFMSQGIEWTEVAVSLQTGMLDAAVFVPSRSLTEAVGCFDNLDYCLWFPNVRTSWMCGMIFPSDWWFALPEELRNGLDEAVLEEYENKWRTGTADDAEYLEHLRASGMKCTCLSPEEVDRWVAQLEPIWWDWAEGVEGGAEGVQSILDVYTPPPYIPDFVEGHEDWDFLKEAYDNGEWIPGIWKQFEGKITDEFLPAGYKSTD